MFQAAGALFFTGIVLVPTIPYLTGLRGPEYDLLGTYLPVALLLSTLSIATASGAVVAVVTELRASGPFTTTLLSVIAISYGLTLIFFSFASTFGRFLLHPDTVSCLGMLWSAMLKIGLSLALGAVAGVALKFMARFVRRREALLMIVLGCILTTCGSALVFQLSPLIANLVLGFVIVNLESRHQDFFNVIERIEEPLFGLFFGLAGAHVDLTVFRSASLLALVTFSARVCGKQLGTLVGAKVCKAPRMIRDYLGLALAPHAGWTIALVIVEKKIFSLSIVSKIMINAVIGSVIIGQLIGLPLVKLALTKVGETLKERRAQEDSR
jgi:Kef-type K+ transport system membrane component KefB